MGPSVLFDKSAIQSLGHDARREAGRYFYTTVPPVLLMEVLADLSLYPTDRDRSEATVIALARKALPADSITNVEFRTLCVANLLGKRIPMDRRPVVGGAQSVVAKNGARGFYIGVQPEDEAVSRWYSGHFSEEDVRFATDWRQSAIGMDLEGIKNQLPKPSFKIRSLKQVAGVVDMMLAQAELQEPLLHWFLDLLRLEQETYERVRFRWRIDLYRRLRLFAPYAHHCLKVQLLFYIGMIHDLLGTRPTNVIDLEYLCYTPFAFIFCSGDKLHQQLAPLVLGRDQSFVGREELRSALNDVAAARKTHANAQPHEDSLIRQLWLRHWKKSPPGEVQKRMSASQIQKLMESVRPIVDALREQDQTQAPRPRFPV